MSIEITWRESIVILITWVQGLINIFSFILSRWGGSCSAAAFLENFVEKDVKWAHIDIAGAGMGSFSSATGFGV